MLLMTGKVPIVQFRTKHPVNCFDLITTESGSGKNAKSAFCVSISLMIFSENFFQISFLTIFSLSLQPTIKFLDLFSIPGKSDNSFAVKLLSSLVCG